MPRFGRSGDVNTNVGIERKRVAGPSWVCRALVAGVLVAMGGGAHALDNGLALTPPMGWNSWNAFAGNIDEAKIRGVIDAMVSNGMRDAGYVYVNLDDNWMANPARDASGNLIADPVRFKSGIKALADYAHSKGMKLGIYSDRGSMTCMNIPRSGGYGNEARDARTYASWGIDYLKYDNCNVVGQMQSDYTTMGKALASSGRNIAYSICAWETQPWMPDIGNLWRSTTDIAAKWDPPATGLKWSIMFNMDGNAGNCMYSRPGAWSDPDMLEVGVGSLTENENRAHFGMWCLLAAPLIAGNDVRNMSATSKSILTHAEAIAINQDSAGVQARRIASSGGVEVWVKPLGKGFTTWAVGLLNRSTSTRSITIDWKSLRLDPTSVAVRDVWSGKDLGTRKDGHTASVPAHGLALLKVVGAMDTAATWSASDMHFVSLSNGYGVFRHDRSNGGRTLTLGGKTHSKGFGVNSPSRTVVPLYGKFSRFQATVGVDAEVSTTGSVVFQVFGNAGTKLYESPICRAGGTPVAIDIPVAGQDSIHLVTTDAGDGNVNDHADWASPTLVLASSSVDVPGRVPMRSGKWRAAIRGRMLSIDRTESGPVDIRILDVAGRELQRSRITGIHSELEMDAIPLGVLLVQIGAESQAGLFSSKTLTVNDEANP